MSASENDKGSATPRRIIDVKEATAKVISFIFSGAIGDSANKIASYSVTKTEDDRISFIASLENEERGDEHIDRYMVNVNRFTGDLSAPQLISLSTAEISEAISQATHGLHHLATATRFTDASFSISYKVIVEELPEKPYLLQLRYHGDVATMNALMQWISHTIPRAILPLPTAFPIADEANQQQARQLGIQITEFIVGSMGNTIYQTMSHLQRLKLVERLGRAFDALWNLPLPGPRLVGELKARRDAEGSTTLSVGPDRHYSLGGPFELVADYLRAWIRARYKQLRKQEEIVDFKNKYLDRIAAFIDSGMLNVPAIVEDVPVVMVHEDMGLHNIMLSVDDPTEIVAIIDWEFCASAPYASTCMITEKLFRQPAMNDFGPEYDHADELRQRFWGTMPKWQEHNQSPATQAFLEWFEFGVFLYAPWRPADLDEVAKKEYWAKNESTVEGFLAKYHK